MFSFQIMFIQVTPNDNLNIFKSATSSCASRLFVSVTTSKVHIAKLTHPKIFKLIYLTLLVASSSTHILSCFWLLILSSPEHTSTFPSYYYLTLLSSHLNVCFPFFTVSEFSILLLLVCQTALQTQNTFQRFIIKVYCFYCNKRPFRRLLLWINI